MNVAHSAPILAELRMSGSPPLKVFNGAVDPKTTPPYVVVYFTVITSDETTLEDVADQVLSTSIVHSVGGNADACQVIADRVYIALQGITPTISGRDCSRVRLTDSNPPRRDESTGQLVITQVDTYEYISRLT